MFATHQGEPVSRRRSRSSSAARAAGRSARPTRTKSSAWTASSRDAASQRRRWRCSTRRIDGEPLPRKVDVTIPQTRDAILFPDKRTTFGVVEMTTGCGRRCQFCVPDLNPQIDLPRDKILAHVRANVREGNKQISLATEDMFIWGQVHTTTPFYFPNREALLDLFRDVVNTPGVEQHVLSHATIAPAVVDPVLIEKLSESMLDKSPIHLPYSEHAIRSTRRWCR